MVSIYNYIHGWKQKYIKHKEESAMEKDFNNVFDDFVMERMGEDIARLREKNERYRNALTEYSELVQKGKNGAINDYRQEFNRLAELVEYIRDLENRYLYYAGMAVHKKMDDVICSFDSFEIFTE